MTPGALDQRQRDSLVCVRAGCAMLEDCRAPDPRLCSLWRQYWWREQPHPPVMEPTIYRPPRRRSSRRRPSWWRRHGEDVACWALWSACVGYFLWHLGAAVVEGRLPVPGW